MKPTYCSKCGCNVLYRCCCAMHPEVTSPIFRKTTYRVHATPPLKKLEAAQELLRRIDLPTHPSH